MIRALAHRLVLMDGWKRAFLAFAAGAFGALSMPPFGFFPALSVSFMVAIWLLDGAMGPRGRLLPALRQAFGIGWCWGFGYFLAGLWWIGSAFLVDAEHFAWLMPFAVLILPAGLALFHALGFALARLIWPANGTRLIAFALAMGAVEYMRGHVLTGFPWNSLGYALAGELHLAQILAFVGLPGLTLIAVLILAAPALLADPGPAAVRVPVAALLALALLYGHGIARLAANPTAYVPDVKLRIMQPGVAQDDKFSAAMRDGIMQRYLSLSDRPTSPDTTGMGDVTHLVWPESAFPFLVARDPLALAQIASILPPGAVLLTGAGRADDPLPGDDTVHYFNAIHVIDSSGTILDSYDKVHLVPFGEYLPFQATLEALGFRQLTQLRGGFTPGTRLRTIAIPGAPPAGMLICYEAIFPGAVVDAANRPGWLLNVTNDAWFGETPGPHQHFLQVRARAIEEGLPIVRAANTGISAVIDPVGRIVSALRLAEIGVLDSRLPVAGSRTVYAQWGDRVPAGLFAILTFILAVGYRYRRKAG